MFCVKYLLPTVAAIGFIGCADSGRLTAPAPSTSLPGTPQLQGNGMVLAPVDSGFVEFSRHMVRGKLLGNGGCQISDQFRLERGQRHAERVVAINPKTCEAVFADGERATPPPGSVRGGPSGLPPAGTADRAGIASATLPPVRPMSMSSSEAESYLWFRDPIFLHVAEDDLYLTWSYDFGLCSMNGRVSHAALPYTTSGWLVLSSSEGQAPAQPGASYCDSWNGFGRSSFMNTVFCPTATGGLGGPTYISFYNEVDGENTGGAYFRFTYSATGGCVALLFFEHDANLNPGSP